MLEKVNINTGKAKFNGEEIHFDLVLFGTMLSDVKVTAFTLFDKCLAERFAFEEQAKQALKQYFKQFNIQVSLELCNGF